LKELNLLDKYSVVGTFGAEVSVPQFRKIKEYFDRIILYGDNDSAGVGMERDIYKAVRRSIPIILKFNYKGHDAGKVKLAQFKRIIKKPMLFNTLYEPSKTYW